MVPFSEAGQAARCWVCSGAFGQQGRKQGLAVLVSLRPHLSAHMEARRVLPEPRPGTRGSPRNSAGSERVGMPTGHLGTVRVQIQQVWE